MCYWVLTEVLTHRGAMQPLGHGPPERTSYPAGGDSPSQPDSLNTKFGQHWTVPRRYCDVEITGAHFDAIDRRTPSG